MSLASPAKQDRIDRHLSRQRGAGVRTLATSFGFTFGATSPQPTVSAPTAEPTPKRRKLEVQDTRTGTQQKSNAYDSEPANEHDGHPRARRRLEGLQEDTAVVIRKGRRDESFVGIKKTTKTRKQRQPPVAIPSTTAEDRPTSCRPRRQAATRAKDQVSRGFIEEAQNVDKLRRGQDTMEPKRRRTRTTTEAADTKSYDEAAVDVSSGESKHLPNDDPAPTSNVETLTMDKTEQIPRRGRPKREIVSQNCKTDRALDQISKLSVTRKPLAETTTNTITRSTSPEKPLNQSAGTISESLPQRSPTRILSPAKALVESKHLPQGQRKPSKFAVSKDTHASKVKPEVVGVGIALESGVVPKLSGSRSKSTREQDVASGKVDDRATCDTGAIESKRKLKVKLGRDVDAKTEQHFAAVNVRKPARYARKDEANIEASRRDGKQAEGIKEESTPAVSAPAEQRVQEETDVDWLLTSKHTAKRPLAERQARNVKRKCKPFKHIAELSDVDLDDLLSNIATYVPRNLESAASATKRR